MPVRLAAKMNALGLLQISCVGTDWKRRSPAARVQSASARAWRRSRAWCAGSRARRAERHDRGPAREYGDDDTVKVPGEIDVQRARRIIEELRRRFGDALRPQEELDYIERLLRDY